MPNVLLSMRILASVISFRKILFELLRRFDGESNSTIFPVSSTIILSLSIIVLRRCATVRTVHLAKRFRIVD
jgi:hypothetical protein